MVLRNSEHIKSLLLRAHGNVEKVLFLGADSDRVCSIKSDIVAALDLILELEAEAGAVKKKQRAEPGS